MLVAALPFSLLFLLSFVVHSPFLVALVLLRAPDAILCVVSFAECPFEALSFTVVVEALLLSFALVVLVFESVAAVARAFSFVDCSYVHWC